MTHTCCPACRLRFARATASGLRACPSCGGHLADAPAGEIVGLPLWEEPDLLSAPAVATAVALPAHPPRS